MELRQLRYFLAAAERLNFTAAAEACHISQSTLSQQLQQLEAHLDSLLFHRVGKRVVLTEAGHQFLPFAQQTLASAQAGHQRLRDLAGLQTGHLQVGVTYTLRPLLLPALAQFARTYPGVHVHVQLGTSAELLAQLVALNLDLVLSFHEALMHPMLTYQPLLESSLCLVVGATSPLSVRTSLTLEELATLPLTLPAAGSSTRRLLEAALATQSLTPHVQLEINDIATVLDFVRTGHGQTVLWLATVQHDVSLHAIPLEGTGLTCQAGVLRLDTAYRKKAAEIFGDLLVAGATQPAGE
jgi:LysR family cyn operon transcriptional activator